MREIVAGQGGLDKVVLESGDGASAEVYLHGAHVTSWRPSPGDRERLFLSRTSAFRAGAPIRGGIPVIFPQFSLEGALPRHGFARTIPWSLQSVERDVSGDAIATFAREDSEETRAIWPHAFHATLTLRVGGERLRVELSVANTGDAPFTFAAALHTYLHVDDVGNVQVIGLHGTPYRESGARDTLRFERREQIPIEGEVDRVFVGAPSRLTMREPAHELAVETSAFPDVVLWNPGAVRASALPDLHAGGERNMLCIEAAAIQYPVVLDVGRRWTGVQHLIDLPRAT